MKSPLIKTWNDLHEDEQGGMSVELTLIVIGLFLLAGVVIAAVTAFVTGQLDQLG